MRCTMYHQKDPHFLSPLSPNDPLVIGLCFATHRPPIFCHSKTSKWFVTQRPPISDFVTQKPIISIIYLAQTLISHNNWSQDFKGFIACGQLDVLYSIFGLKEDPHFTTLSLKDPIIMICHWKTPYFLVAPVTERPLCLRCLLTLVHHSDIRVPPPWEINAIHPNSQLLNCTIIML